MNSETIPPNESENRRNPSRQSREQVQSPGVQTPDARNFLGVEPSNSTLDQRGSTFSASNSMTSPPDPQNIFSSRKYRGSTGEGRTDPPSSSATGKRMFGRDN